MKRDTQKQLEWLHKNGWGDSKVAGWLTQKVNSFMKETDTSEDFAEGPSVRTISRWRREGTKPTSQLHAKLIFMLYKTEKGANE